MGFLKGIKIDTLLSTHEEWHAFIEGFCDGFFPISKYKPSKELQADIESEHHYYRPAFIVGVIAAVWFWIGVWKVVT